MPRKVVPTEQETETWNMTPGTDEGWESSVAGSQATAAHLKQTKKSWVLSTPPRTIDTSKKSSRKSKSDKKGQTDSGAGINSRTSRQTLFGRTSSTPATELSTPERNRSSEELPETYVELIANAFGSKADLYQDILGVSRSATPRAVRIAYFKRGREVLSERQPSAEQKGAQPTSATISGHISDISRLRFQAVSMAYEIVSNPAWFDAYERCRLITEDDDDEEDDDSDYEEAETPDVLSDPDISSTRSLASMSALRRSSSNGSLRSRRTHTGVRWNEEVEELVFNLDPEENKNRKKGKKKKKKSKGKHKKKRIAVETDVDLETHLEQLDKEAEQNFVHDFLDDLEQSIEQLISSSFGADDDKSSESDEEKDKDPKDAVIPKQLFPEMENEPLPKEFKTPKQPIQQRRVPNAPKKKNKIPRKLDTSDIEDDDFEMYKNHRQRHILNSKNSIDDKNSFDHRQEEAMDGSEPFDVVRCNPSAQDNGEDSESYVSFQEIKDPSPIRASLSYDAPYTTKGSDAASTRSAPGQSSKRGKSTWHSSQQSPNRATMDSFLSSASATDRNISMRNDLVFAAPDGEQTQVALPPRFTPPSSKSPKRAPRRSTRARSKSKESKHFQAPTDISVSKRYEIQSFDDGDSAAFTVDDSVSTLSASVVQRHINRDLTNSRYKEALEQDKAEQERLKQVKEGQVAGTETTTNLDRLNTSMDDVLQSTAVGTTPSTPANRSKSSIEEDNTEFVEISPRTNPEVDVTNLFCFGLCGDEELAETARAAANAQGTPDDPSFTAFLMVYLNAMATDLARLGHSIQENVSGFEFMQSLEINDKDLDGMLTILESEMEEVPADLAKTLSQEFMPSSSSYADEAAEPGIASARSF